MTFETMSASEARLLRKQSTPKAKKQRAKPVISEHTKLLAAADKQFSLWFRANEADEYGRVNCAACGKNMSWKEPDGSCQCGHFVSRGFNATRFNPMNTAIECRQCNYYLEGNKQKLRTYLENRYGKEQIALIEATGIHKRLTDFELKEIAKHFKAEFEKVKRIKGL